MIFAHVGHVTPLPASTWLAFAVIAGFVAALAMNGPMLWLSEGYVPAAVAASVLLRTVPSRVSRRNAVVVHHTAGLVAGGFYGGIGVLFDSVLSPIGRVAGLSMLAHLLAVIAVVLFLYAFFAWLVLPQYGGSKRDSARTVRRHWLFSTAVFGSVVAFVVPALVVWVR
jgi:hypothetical protein